MLRTKAKILISLGGMVTLIATCFLLLTAAASQDELRVSGSVEEGYRLLTVAAGEPSNDFIVYRGDYIKIVIEEALPDMVFSIPGLAVNQKLPMDIRSAPYFKMKKTGKFPFTLGKLSGTITVVEYDKPQYRAVTSEEASRLIANLSPIVLDVRTRQEYASGHLADSIHIPVQELQSRYGELASYANDNILIYCATGNRSTVAAKILIDNGFTRIFNLREGIHVWAGKGFKVVR